MSATGRTGRDGLAWSSSPLGRRARSTALLGLLVSCGPVRPTPTDPGRLPMSSAPTVDGAAPDASVGADGLAGRTSGAEAAPRDPRWAAPLSRPGLPNLHRVSEALYRGAQPEPAGFRELHALGVRTIVNLRSSHADGSLIEASGVPPGAFQYVEIPMKAWDVDESELVRFLHVAADPARQPLFVHCQHGADRTGIAVASYRIAVEGWSPAEAAAEMTEGGYGFHAIWSQLARQVRALDPARLRVRAGIAAPAARP